MLADGGAGVKSQNAFYKRNWHYIALQNTWWKTEAKISPKSPRPVGGMPPFAPDISLAVAKSLHSTLLTPKSHPKVANLGSDRHRGPQGREGVLLMRGARPTPGRHGPVSPERASREAASAIDGIKQGSSPFRSSLVEPRSCQHRRGTLFDVAVHR